MKKKPWPFLFLTLFHLIVTVSMPVQIIVLYGHSLHEWEAIFSKLTLVNWAVMAVTLFCAFLAFEAHRWVRNATLLAIVIVALNNWIVATWSTDFASWVPLLGTLVFCLVQSVLLLPDVQRVLKYPEQRWWLSAHRQRSEFPIWIETSNRQAFQSVTFDLSLSGAFIPFTHVDSGGEMAEGFPVPVRRGENILVRLGLDSAEEIACRAEVVRRSASRGRYPAGLGLRFSGLDGLSRRRLKRYIS